MYDVSSVIYGKVAEMIIERVGRSDYLSERLEFEVYGVLCCLLFSAIAYRRSLYLPEGEFEELSDLVPVWWEFHTYDSEGEVLNNFSFNELRQYFN